VVARGLTNMQVALLLSMSPRTVESHLSRIYAKLQVRSRYELARLFGSLGRPGENATALAALSPRELEVIALVGTGMTNRQAARLLFVSPKTVEFHLARVFAKLEVSSREQLYRIVHSCEACDRSLQPPRPRM
jgi:DNA-binding CsgD family transcriptional regulator